MELPWEWKSVLARGFTVYMTYAPVNKLVHSSKIQKHILRICLLTKSRSQYDFVMTRQNSSNTISCRGSAVQNLCTICLDPMFKYCLWPIFLIVCSLIQVNHNEIVYQARFQQNLEA